MAESVLKNTLIEVNGLVDPVINEVLSANIDKNNVDATLYQCAAGGKRLRPALAIVSSRLFGGADGEVIYPAAALEILHNYTLIVDDIIDHSETRRDKPTVWKKYGKSMAECFSLYYAASIFEAAQKTKSNGPVSALLAKTLKIIIDGEIIDIFFERSGRDDEPYVIENRPKEISRQDYFDMVGKKTAILLSASCEVGGICASASEEQLSALRDYGFNMGVAFQIQDDLLDIFGDEAEFGKKIGKDLIEKKMGNFIVLLALEKLEGEDRDKVWQLLHSLEPVSDAKVSEITKIIEKTNAKEEASEVANSFMEKALKALEKLPQNQHRDTLVEIANYIVKRTK